MHVPLVAGLANGARFGLPVGAVLVAAAVFKHYQRKAPIASFKDFKELDEAPAGRLHQEPKVDGKTSKPQLPSALDPKANKVAALRQSFELMQAH